jgi:hypothetical protein
VGGLLIRFCRIRLLLLRKDLSNSRSRRIHDADDIELLSNASLDSQGMIPFDVIVAKRNVSLHT